MYKLANELCSIEQIELCKKYGILTKEDIIQIKEIKENLHKTNEKEYILQLCQLLKERYKKYILNHSIIENQTNTIRIYLLEKVQILSNLLDQHVIAQQDLAELIIALKKLRLEWKNRTKDIEHILYSILSDVESSYKIVKISKSNLNQFGLTSNSLGQYHLIFNSTTTEIERYSILNQLASDFSIVFEANVNQNLERMVDIYERVNKDDKEDISILNQINSLNHYLFNSSNSTLTQPNSIHLNSTLYHSNLFNSNSTLHLLKFNKRSRSKNQFLPYPSTKQSFWSISLTDLANHYKSICHGYYTTLLKNSHQLYTQRSHTFEFTTFTLMKFYNSIQLEQAYNLVNKTLISYQN